MKRRKPTWVLFYLQGDGGGSRSGWSIRYVIHELCPHTVYRVNLAFKTRFPQSTYINLAKSLSGQTSDRVHSKCWERRCAAVFHQKSKGNIEKTSTPPRNAFTAVLCPPRVDKCAAATVHSQLLPVCLLCLLLWFQWQLAAASGTWSRTKRKLTMKQTRLKMLPIGGWHNGWAKFQLGSYLQAVKKCFICI